MQALLEAGGSSETAAITASTAIAAMPPVESDAPEPIDDCEQEEAQGTEWVPPPQDETDDLNESDSE